ncbi:Sodium/hydrogen exchanger family-domain-containing protein [Penicillium argentinense]|uniref:Sodium/hydrogen exchanger family-domain-containing protein n=1 Tax=Penicillium argentinense TaxID=1131581 RepID=A0A9W9G519_9EURO|nr:Sodium/hydrogen exchanger family-domain-containing protein [Penicillium argentinense]KAJ5111412.1 Sodium/hydrogen exchanger family-domain-containing protein [Penicillium argentinense]
MAVGTCARPPFADDNVPGDLQDLIIAGSGANDGLGHTFSPFRSTSSNAASGGAGAAIGLRFGSDSPGNAGMHNIPQRLVRRWGWLGGQGAAAAVGRG